MLTLLLALPALAVDTWLGGAVNGGVVVGDGGVAASPVQVEGDARFQAGALYGRLDANVFVDPAAPGWEKGTIPVEWAMLQYGPNPWFVRAGITNPDMGLEDWDPWNNYLPTFSFLFDGASPGRLGGGEVGWQFEDGGTAFLFGGYDLDWEAASFGGGYSVEHDGWSTWSGVAVQPTEDQYGFFGALELYPHDAVWLTLDGGAGLFYGSPFAGAQLVVNVIPESVVNPVARVEGLWDPEDTLELGVVASASVGANIKPVSWIHLGLEGKALIARGGGMSPYAVASLTFQREDPPAYALREEEEGAEE